MVRGECSETSEWNFKKDEGTVHVVIVGSERRWWTPDKISLVKTKIGQIAYLYTYKHPKVKFISGACPKGGVDIWAREVLAPSMGDSFIEFKPQVKQWNDLKLPNGGVARGYRYRNQAMARVADYLYDIEPEWELWMEKLKKEPYQGFRSDQWGKFFRRSGGHWTLQQAKKRKIHTDVIVI